MNSAGHLRLKGLVFWGRHGHHAFEREAGNRFEVDIDLEADFAAATRSDRLEDTADLEAVYEITRKIVQGPPCSLIETVADRIASQLCELDKVIRATVRVRKINPPLQSAVSGLMEAEITRGS